MKYPEFKACAAHAAPVFLDAKSTVEKACALIADTARAGAQLIAFPESFVPGFPMWAAVQAPIKNHEYFKRLAANSVEVPGPEGAQLCASAIRAHAFSTVDLASRKTGAACAAQALNCGYFIRSDLQRRAAARPPRSRFIPASATGCAEAACSWRVPPSESAS